MRANGDSHLRRKKPKNRVTTRRQTGTLLLSFPRWCGLDRQRSRRWTPENCCWLLASILWNEKSEKKSSADAAKDGPLVRPLSKVTWFGTTKKNDGHRGTAAATGVSHMRREKRKKSSDDAATNGDTGAFVLWVDVAWPDHAENDR